MKFFNIFTSFLAATTTMIATVASLTNNAVTQINQPDLFWLIKKQVKLNNK